MATNLSCSAEDTDLTGADHRWWRVSTDEAGSIHSLYWLPFLPLKFTLLTGQIGRLAWMPKFNDSLSVSPLLSERDVHALEEHFLHIELARTERKIDELEAELVEKYGEHESGWPVGVPEAGKEPNRFQGNFEGHTDICGFWD